ncbi:MAG: S41 family peptidase [SAR324 cluster bacterium]|nr:S41 family peptidase [SAR324 cluster bacterium]
MKILLGLLHAFLVLGWMGSCTIQPPLPKTGEVHRPFSSEMIAEVLMRIQLDYADPEKTDPHILLAGAQQEVERAFVELRTEQVSGESGTILKLWTNQWYFETAPSRLANLHDLNEVLQEVHAQLILGGVSEDRNGLEQLLLRGVTQKLDPYSVVLPGELYREFRSSVGGSFAGVGLMVGFRGNQLIVISPMDGSPAARSGILPLDRIIRVDGEETEYLTLDEILFRLRGEKGSLVRLHIIREGVGEPLQFELEREVIQVKSVDVLEWQDDEKRLRYVRIKSFQESTVKELRDKLGNLQQDEGILLDLRNNPGGLLEQAVAVSDLFLDRGQRIVSTRGRILSQHFRSRRLFQPQAWLQAPMVILVNSGSASASEIVTAALQQNDRALVVGEKTFGKGTIQSLTEMRVGSGLKLTIGDYLTPSGDWINETGVMPDLVLQPVIISDEMYRLASARWGQEKHDTEDPVVIHYLLEKDEEDQVTLPMDELQLEDLRKDFFVEVAEHLLEGLWSVPPHELRARGISLGSISKNQEKKIASRLSDHGIDWSFDSSADRPEPNRILAGVSWSSDGNSWIGLPTLERLEVGRKTFLRFHIKNTSGHSFQRLLAVGRSGNEVLNSFEFPLGRLEGGAEMERSKEISLSPGLLGAVEPLELVIMDDLGKIIYELRTHLHLENMPQPRFAMEVQLQEDGSWQSLGNGDGEIQAGESPSIRIRVNNSGNRESGNTVLQLTRFSGDIRIPRGRVQLGPLNSGVFLEDSLVFRIPEGKQVQGIMKLEVRDQNSSLPGLVYSWAPGEPLPEHKLQGPFIESLRLSREAPEVIAKGLDHLFRLTGLIRDPEGLKEFYVFVNGRKVHYRQFDGIPAVPNKKKFSLSLRLPNGRNQVEIFARDTDGLSAQKRLHWWNWSKLGRS